MRHAIEHFVTILLILFSLLLCMIIIIYPLQRYQKNVETLQNQINYLLVENQKQQSKIDSLERQVRQDIYLNQKIWE